MIWLNLRSKVRSLMDGVRLRIDGVSLLSVYVVLQIAIPSRFVIGPLGGAGSPAVVWGLGCLILWGFSRVQQSSTWPVLPRPKPVRLVAFVLAGAFILSYIAASIRPINGEESNLANLGLVGVAGWFGILLVAHDGIENRWRLNILVDRLVLLATLLAILGLVQFVTHQLWVDRISIPGLTTNSATYGALSRGSFTRPSGTAIHPIEFGAVLSMMLPVALARASAVWTDRQVGDQEPRRLMRRWLSVLVIAIAIALSSSRSAFVCAAVGVIIVILRLPSRLRGVALAGGACIGILIFVAVPGMLGSVLGMFTGISTDSSALSRVDSYSIAWSYIVESPVIGRGFSTFLPRYRIFDNQYLSFSVELGIGGTAVVLCLFLTAIVVGFRVAKFAANLSDGLTIQGLAGGVAAGAVSFALFDALSFPMVPGLLFLMIGMIGASRLIVSAVAPRRARLANEEGDDYPRLVEVAARRALIEQ